MPDISPITRFYGKWAFPYEVVARWTPGIRSVRRKTVELLQLSNGDTVVEIGCGTGANFPYLRDSVGASGRVIGIDITPGMLAFAQRRIDRSEWDNVSVIRADARHPPITSVDAVLATFVVGMFDDPSLVIDRWSSHINGSGNVALLDAKKSDHRFVGPLNWLFGMFVKWTSPKKSRLQHANPVEILTERVDEARQVLFENTDQYSDESLAIGFLRLSAAQIVNCDTQVTNR